MPKFLLPTIFNNHVVKDESGYMISNGLGSGLAFEFMTPDLLVAAQNAGYQTYYILYDTLKKENDVIKADLIEVEFGNTQLLDRLMSKEEYLREIIQISEKILKQQRIELDKKKKETDARIAELSAKQKENLSEKESQELESLQKQSKSHEKRLADDNNWQHNIRILPFMLVRLNSLVIDRKDPEIIEFLDKIAAQDPAITWDKQQFFFKRKRINGVAIEEFLGEEKEESVIYIRDFREGEQFKATTDIFCELEAKGIKFPTSMKTLEFHEKLVVEENAALKECALPMTCIAADDVESLKKFYKQHGREEGLVLKPYLIYGGNAIFFLEAGISDEKLDARIAEVLTEVATKDKELSKKKDVVGAFDFSKLIIQKKLHNLNKDHQNNLYGGDIRFTAINGELVGGVLRYREEDSEAALSYNFCRNLLPDNQEFNQENIEKFLSAAKSSNNQNIVSYYENLLKVLEVAQKVTKWCGDNGHFHVGFDVLIGRDSKGNWTNSLTELNTGWPDCVPEHRWRNNECGIETKWANPCAAVIDLVKTGQYISPTKQPSEHPAHLTLGPKPQQPSSQTQEQ